MDDSKRTFICYSGYLGDFDIAVRKKERKSNLY
jgi:hypothetical protein